MLNESKCLITESGEGVGIDGVWVTGYRLQVTGGLQLVNRSYEDKDGNKKYFTEVVVNEILMLEKES